MTTATLERKLVVIAGNQAHPREFLLLDLKDGMLRGAFWRLRTPTDRPNENLPPQSLLDALAAEGVVPAGKRTGWWRVAAERDSLDDLLYVLLNDSRHDWQAMALYVRATGWGEKLP